MAIWTISLAFLLYLLTCLSNLRQRDYPMALVWFAYALSQIGFLLYEIQKIKD